MPAMLENIAGWAAALTYDQIPPRVVQKARLQLLSTVAAAHAGARHEIGQAVLSAADYFAGDGPCTIVPTGKKADLMAAAWANACLSMSLDYDDYLLFGHTGHSAVMASLAAAEKNGRSLKELLTAQVIANEVSGRLGAGVLLGPHNGQGWSHIHLAGAAAAAAKLMELSPRQTAHAMGISLYQPTYVLWPGFMGPDSKTTTAATPVVTGLAAAALASKGATGPLDVIEHPQGYLARMSYVPTPFFISGFGRSWVTDTLAFKIYPGCAYIDTTVDAVLMIMQEYEKQHDKKIEPSEVKKVRVEATILTVEMDNLSKTGGAFDPLNPVSINFSIPGNVALALINGRLDADDMTKAALRENAERIVEISSKVELVHDWSLTVKMIETIDKVLDTRTLLSRLSLKDLARMRSRAKEQYRSSLGFSLTDLKDLFAQAPQVKGRLWERAKDMIGTRLSAGARAAREFDLGRLPLEQFTMPFAAQVTVTMKDGTVMTAKQDVPWGGPGHALDLIVNHVHDKYTREASKNLDKSRVEALVDSADELEERFTVEKLVESCCGG